VLKAIIANVKPDFIQLHGRENVARVGEIRSLTALPVIKVVAVAEASDLDGVAGYESVADMLMFDAKAPVNATREGGHGAAFDWRILSGHSFRRPWLLAGGLNAENVARAVQISNAPIVDVSSGVETASGVKSPDMIRAFVDAARNAQYVSGQA
jgi:phosphoribosylanthranilate isomerase